MTRGWFPNKVYQASTLMWISPSYSHSYPSVARAVVFATPVLPTVTMGKAPAKYQSLSSAALRKEVCSFCRVLEYCVSPYHSILVPCIIECNPPPPPHIRAVTCCARRLMRPPTDLHPLPYPTANLAPIGFSLQPCCGSLSSRS